MRHAKHVGILILAASFCNLAATTARAGEDAYFDLRIDQLTIIEGKLPKLATEGGFQGFRSREKFGKYVALDGPGEAYSPSYDGGGFSGFAMPHLVVHTPERRDVTGRIFFPNDDATGMVAVKFKIPASQAKPEAKAIFFRMMADYYEILLADNAPGAAWFRYRAREAREQIGGKPFENPQGFPRRPDSLDDTYSLFSGNQALAENLQLDKALPPGAAAQGANQIDVDSIPGISVAAIDWKNYIKGKNPAMDSLAGAIPADQHAIFFHSFEAMIALADEADRNGGLALQVAETRSEDAGIRSQYERQLGLSLTGLGRLLGPRLISGVAITGSDPYLRGGSDLAILLTPKEGAALKPLIAAQINAARQMTPDAKEDDGKVGGLSYTGVRSPDRALCSYLAVLNGGAVVVSNSQAQLACLAAVQDGKADPLSKAPEYIFFRDRYKLGDEDESALIVLSDATIRRWCGARWRIADSRRTRAAAVLADLDARNLDDLVVGKAGSGPIGGDFHVPELGALHMTPHGAVSAGYGSLGFLTPISELKLDKVTEGEAQAYKRWRDTYETNWRGVFDPIVVRLHVSRKKLAADLTVLPMIFGSEYRPLVDIAGGAKIDPAASDPHDCMVRYGLSINTNSAQVKAASIFVTQMAPNLKIDPLGWVGQSISVYGDNDPFWSAWATSADPEKFIESHFAGIPIGVRVEVSNGFKLTAFLVAAHAFIDQSAPGMTVWENLVYKDQPYVKISPSAQARGQNAAMQDVALYYRATGDALLLTLNEGMLKHAIDRQLDRDEARKAGKQLPRTEPPILGENLILQANAPWFDFMEHLGRTQYQTFMQKQSWSNLPILNEWKHRYADQDPLKLYERFFHARLIDPAGGEYVWNEKWQTMESTVYGSPAQPKDGPAGIAVFKGLLHANLGVTFENDGLRAKTEVEREEK